MHKSVRLHCGHIMSCGCVFLVSYVEEGYGGLYKAPTKEERRKQTAKSRERSDQVY